MTAAHAGAMGESGWIGSRWTVPVLVVWQAPVPSVEFPPVSACAPAWWVPNRQSAAHPTTGWATRKAVRVAKAKPRERRAWSIEG